MPFCIYFDFNARFAASWIICIDFLKDSFFGQDGFGFEPIENISRWEIYIFFFETSKEIKYFHNLLIFKNSSVKHDIKIRNKLLLNDIFLDFLNLQGI